MRVVENGGVLAIGLDDLVQRLRDQAGLDPVAADIGEGVLEEVQFPSWGNSSSIRRTRRPSVFCRCDLGQALQDLVDMRRSSAFRREISSGGNDQIERDGRAAR
jgi:hypothetical protein